MPVRFPLTSHRHLRAGAFAVMLLLLAACGSSSPLRTMGSAPRTAHERYARALRDTGLDSTALGREWLTAGDSALRAAYTVALPARELGAYSRTEARAVAYRIALRDGERLRVSLRADGPPARLYLDLFELSGDTIVSFEHRQSAGDTPPTDSAAALLTLVHEATADGTYALRLQPELLRSGRYEIVMRIEPILAFPVDGRGNSAIQSLFGVERDGGRRAHHGIDIFAPRGTPVIAATDGVVRSTSPNALGGNVVWLSDALRSQTLNYAHLDRHIVSAGQQVRMGDTLGFVGNTGNARTTPPHLHFGIYARGRGPIDPLHYVRRVTATLPTLRADTSLLGRQARVAIAQPLRDGAQDGGSAAPRVRAAATVQVMGATADLLRVQLDDGTSGYVPARTVKAVTQ
jgi:murein DD-endopeptidase MepM/ murein hydrolase activator NlpD